MMKAFSIVQVISAILLIVLILLQKQGSGLGELFGGSGNVYRKKRGIEKLLFQTTIITSIVFFGISLAKAVL